MNLPPPMFFYELEQGTQEWFEVRLGVPTASNFADILTKGRKGEPSKTRLTYMYKLIGEKLTDQPQNAFGNAHTERGHALEPEARELYAMLTDAEPVTVGFVARGNIVGASPDSLVGNAGLLEIKTKLPHLQIPVLLADEVPDEHMPQLQGQLWVAERDWVDFLSYCPGLRPFKRRVHRDEQYIAMLAQAVEEFHEQMQETLELVRAR